MSQDIEPLQSKLHLWPFGNIRMMRSWSRASEWLPFSGCWCVFFPPPPHPIPFYRLHGHHTPSLQNSDNGCCKVRTKHQHFKPPRINDAGKKKSQTYKEQVETCTCCCSSDAFIGPTGVTAEYGACSASQTNLHWTPPSSPPLIGPRGGVSRTSLPLESVSARVSHQTWQLAGVTLQAKRQSSSHWCS